MSDKHFLWEFFDPEVVAVIGARSTPGFGFSLPITLNRRGHGDKVRLVNPRGGELHGMHLYKSIKEVPPPVNLAVVISPAPTVPQILIEIAESGIKNVILECAGFAEIGEEGRALQEKCRAIALEKGLRVMGPNCVGVVNAENKFSTGEVMDEALEPGTIGLVAQSGVFGSIVLDAFPSKGLKISRGVTLGNRLIVDESDVLDFLREDESTKLVLMYLEGAADGTKLRKALERITPIKPVLVLKSGKTAEGMAATSSHTGSMAGDDEIYEGLFEQTGAIRVGGVREMMDLAAVFTQQPLPQGNRLCILTSSGSMGAVSMDVAVQNGLVASKLSEETVNRVRGDAPAWMNVRNPLDVGPSGMFQVAFEAALEDPGVDMLMMVPTIPYAVIDSFKAVGVTASSWMGELSEIRNKAPEKPVVAGIIGHPNWFNDLREICGEEVTLIEHPEHAAHALAMLTKYAHFRNSR